MSSLRIWCRPDALIVLAADAPEHIAVGVGEAVADGTGQIASRVISAVTADGVADAPPFLFAAIVDEGVRILVRGALTAQATGDDGTTADISAGRASTWRDDVVRDVRRIDLLDDGRPWVTWTPVRAGEPDAGPVPEPVIRADQENTLDDAAFDQLIGSTSGPHDTLIASDDERDDEAGDETAGDDDFLGLLTATSHLGHEPDPTASQDSMEPPPSPPSAPEPGPAPAPAPAHETHQIAPAPAPPPPTEPPARPPLITGIPPARQAPSPAPHAPDSPPPPDPGVVPTPLPPPPAAAPPLPPPPAPDPADAPMIGTGLDEHDGMTISVADLGNPGRPAPATPGQPIDGAHVQAVYCPSGHANPVDEPQCRVCRQMIAARTPVTIPRPVIACMTFDSGLMVDIDRPQLIGRRPSVMPDSGGEIPNLISLPSPDGEISRHHLAIHLEGWEVLIEDLASTNGTELTRPGQPAIRLRSHEPTLATPGSSVVLAGTVRFTLNHPDH